MVLKEEAERFSEKLDRFEDYLADGCFDCFSGSDGGVGSLTRLAERASSIRKRIEFAQLPEKPGEKPTRRTETLEKTERLMIAAEERITRTMRSILSKKEAVDGTAGTARRSPDDSPREAGEEPMGGPVARLC